MITIRAHHLLCMQGFQGYGYSAEFVANFSAIIAELKKNPRTKVEIIVGSDDVCAHCPYNVNEKCQLTSASQEKLTAFDINVLKMLCIHSGIVLEFREIIELLSQTFTTQAIKQKVCGECLWQGKCLWLH